MENKETPQREASGSISIGTRIANSLSRRGGHGLAVRFSKFGPVLRSNGRFPLANSYYHAGQYQEAAAEFAAVLEDDRHNDSAASRMTTAAIRSRDVELIVLAVGALVRANVPRPQEILRLANELRKLQREEADFCLGHAFREWESADAHNEIVKDLEAAGEAQWRILEVMLEGEHLHSDDHAWVWKLVNRLASAERHEEAVERCERLKDAMDSKELFRYASILEKVGMHDQRMLILARSVRIASDGDVKKYGVGVYHEADRNWRSAAASYIQQLSLEPDQTVRAELYNRAAYCFEAELDFASAILNFEKAIGLDPNNSRLWGMYGNSLELEGRLDDAHHAYAYTMKLSATDERNFQFRAGYVRWQQGRFKEAYKHLLRFAFDPAELESTVESLPNVVGANGLGSEHVRGHSSTPQPSESLDSRAHAEWADLYFQRGRFRRSARHYRMSYISGGLSRNRLGRWMVALESLNDLEEACRVAVEWRANPEPLPLKLERPARGGVEARNIRYANFRKHLTVQNDLIAYESSLGLSVDCNPLAICRELLKSRPGSFIHVWFVSSEAQLPTDLQTNPDVITVLRDTDNALKVLASAAYLVNNSTFPTHPVLRAEQRYMNTWHGTPLKKMMRDSGELFGHANIARNFLQATSLPYGNTYSLDRVVGSADVLPLVKDKTCLIGSPRNDVLIGRGDDAETESPNVKTILIAPTWRPDSDLETEVRKLNEAYTALARPGRRVLVRAHHYVENKLAELGMDFDVVPRSVPTMDLLPNVDVLVTDYSSIFFDFALTRRPIVFYVPDWETYKDSRGLYLGQEELPGTICNDLQELDQAVENGRVPGNIEGFVEKFSPRDDGMAAERAVRELLDGPTFGELKHRAVQQPAILLRGEFRANGITSALVAMANSLSRRGRRVAVTTNTAAVREDASRQQQLARLEPNIPVIGRVGPMVSTALEYHARRLASRTDPKDLRSNTRLLVDSAYQRESLRVLGTSHWNAVVEYEGYSDFWSDFVLGSKTEATSTAIFMHSDIIAESKMKFPWLNRIAQRYTKFDGAVAVSEELAAINHQKLLNNGIADLDIRAAKNVVDYVSIEEEALGAYDSDLQEFIEGADHLVLAVGRLSPEKNHSFLIDVAASVIEESPNTRFLVCGDGPLRGQLQSQIDRLNLNENFLLAGQRGCIYPLMNRADVFVLPSLHEGQSVVLLECSVIGTPSLASDIESARVFSSMGVQTESLEPEKWAKKLIEHHRGDAVLPRTDADIRSYVNDAISQFERATGLY